MRHPVGVLNSRACHRGSRPGGAPPWCTESSMSSQCHCSCEQGREGFYPRGALLAYCVHRLPRSKQRKAKSIWCCTRISMQSLTCCWSSTNKLSASLRQRRWSGRSWRSGGTIGPIRYAPPNGIGKGAAGHPGCSHWATVQLSGVGLQSGTGGVLCPRRGRVTGGLERKGSSGKEGPIGGARIWASVAWVPPAAGWGEPWLAHAGLGLHGARVADYLGW